MSSEKYYRSKVTLGVLLLLLFAIRISFGQNYWVQVVNKTGYYIHVLINGRSYLYVKPDGHLKDDFNSDEVKIKVLYAPGQKVTGEISRVFYASTSSDIICDRGIFCTGDPDLSVNWHVTPEDFIGADSITTQMGF